MIIVMGHLANWMLRPFNVSLTVSGKRQLEKKLNSENEETIGILNRCLQDKSGRQIHLNELYETTNQNQLTEKELLGKLEKLNADLSADRIRIRRGIIQLESEKKELKGKITRQEAQNMLLVGPYETESSKLNTLILRIRDHSNKLSEQNLKFTELTQQIESQQSQLNQQNRQNETLQIKKESLQNELEMMKTTHMHKMDTLRQKLQETLEREQVSKTNIQALKMKLDTAKQESEAIEVEESRILKLVKKEKKEAKAMDKKLIGMVTEVGQLEQEVTEMAAEKDILVRNNISILSTYTARLENMQLQLGAEQKERVKAEREHRQITRETTEFKDAYNRFLRITQRRVQAARTKKSNLLEEESQLQNGIEDERKMAVELREEIDNTRDQVAKESEELESRIKEQDSLLERKLEEVSEKKAMIAAETPPYEAVKARVEKREKFLNELKQHQIDLNMAIKDLDQKTRRLSLENDRNVKMLAESTTRVSKLDDESAQHLQNDCNELAKCEKTIYITGCRLKTARTENARLEWAIREQESQMQVICQKWEHIVHLKSRVRGRIVELQELIGDYGNREHDCVAYTVTLCIDNLDTLHNLQLTNEHRETALGEVVHSITGWITELGRAGHVAEHSEKTGDSGKKSNDGENALVPAKRNTVVKFDIIREQEDTTNYAIIPAVA